MCPSKDLAVVPCPPSPGERGVDEEVISSSLGPAFLPLSFPTLAALSLLCQVPIALRLCGARLPVDTLQVDEADPPLELSPPASVLTAPPPDMLLP